MILNVLILCLWFVSFEVSVRIFHCQYSKFAEINTFLKGPSETNFLMCISKICNKTNFIFLKVQLFACISE